MIVFLNNHFVYCLFRSISNQKYSVQPHPGTRNPVQGNPEILIVLFRWAAVIFDPPVRVSYVYLLASNSDDKSEEVDIYSRTENDTEGYYEGAIC